jgi:hypothetical protein
LSYTSVADLQHFDVDPVPHPTFHFDADLDPSTCHFDADPDHTFHFDADPDPAHHFYAVLDADPDPTFQFDPEPDPQRCPTLLYRRWWVDRLSARASYSASKTAKSSRFSSTIPSP